MEFFEENKKGNISEVGIIDIKVLDEVVYSYLWIELRNHFKFCVDREMM